VPPDDASICALIISTLQQIESHTPFST